MAAQASMAKSASETAAMAAKQIERWRMKTIGEWRRGSENGLAAAAAASGVNEGGRKWRQRRSAKKGRKSAAAA